MARILVIDDDERLREVIQEILTRKGYEVLLASDGDTGIELYRKEKPDLVITDILMPEKDGATMIRELNQEFPSVKIIAMSGGGVGKPEDYLKEIAAHSNLCASLAKPFAMKDLLDAVIKALE